MADAMMCELKPEGEKLLRVRLRLEDGMLTGVVLSGDFFVHPEEGIYSIQESLEGVARDYEKVLEAVRSIIQKNGIELLGVSPETIAKAVVSAR